VPYLIICLVFCTVFVWMARRRIKIRAVNSLIWPKSADPKKLARYVQLFLTSHDIESTVEDDAVIDLTIPGRQFLRKLPTIMLICRDRQFLTGRSTFQDLFNACSNAHRGTMPIIVTSCQITPDLIGYSLEFGVSLIPPSELRALAAILRQAKKAAQTVPYEGGSKILAAHFKRAVPSI
jgi:hypothetical protein